MRLMLMRVLNLAGTEREIRALVYFALLPEVTSELRMKRVTLWLDEPITEGETVIDTIEGSPLDTSGLELVQFHNGTADLEAYRKLDEVFEEIRKARALADAGTFVDLGDKIA
jgi:hypothetical protein